MKAVAPVRCFLGIMALMSVFAALIVPRGVVAAPGDDDDPFIADPPWAAAIREHLDNDQYTEALAALKKLEPKNGKTHQFHVLMAEAYEGKADDAETDREQVRWLRQARESYLKAEQAAPAKDKPIVKELRELVEADLRDLGGLPKGGPKAQPTKPGFGNPPAKPAKPEVTRPELGKPAPKAEGGFKVGDKVEAWNGTWHLAEVIEIGTGNYAGHYKVHYDGFSNVSDQYLKADSVRARKAAFNPDFSEGPRLAKYSILSYGNIRNPLRLGEIELKAGGKYRYAQNGGKLIGEGDYSYDAGSKKVTWKTGPLKDTGWGGAFEIDREGKTHKIRLNRVTIAVHSTDA